MWNLSWPFRRKILFEELEDVQGDVVCLQEVQADHFEQDISPFMASLGYDGIYKSKSREYMGQYGKVRHKSHLFVRVYLFLFDRWMDVQPFGKRLSFQ